MVWLQSVVDRIGETSLDRSFDFSNLVNEKLREAVTQLSTFLVWSGIAFSSQMQNVANGRSASAWVVRGCFNSLVVELSTRVDDRFVGNTTWLPVSGRHAVWIATYFQVDVVLSMGPPLPLPFQYADCSTITARDIWHVIFFRQSWTVKVYMKAMVYQVWNLNLVLFLAFLCCDRNTILQQSHKHSSLRNE